MTISTCTRNTDDSAAHMQDVCSSLQRYSFPRNYGQTVLPQEVIENLIDGVLVLTEERELIYTNDCARRILRQLNQNSLLANPVPREIWYICQTLIESRHLFPNQYWSLESKVFVDSSVVLNVQAKWINLETIERPCLLLSIRDQYQSIKSIATEESQKYKLTSREQEIWLLHRANYTYKQVASELCITPNTVKKHMKNIYLKQKSIFEDQDN
jgi:DNA-binding CsgD family transcriptional regulator